MIKAIILAVLAATNVPFMTQHRNILPKTEVTTNFYGSVTGIVDQAYIESHGGGGGGGGGGGCDTNAVSGIITNHVTSGYLCTVEAANDKFLEKSPDSDVHKIYWDGINLQIGAAKVDFGASVVEVGPEIKLPNPAAIKLNYTYQTLPAYLESTSWHGSNKTLADYGITDAYTRTEAGNTFVKKTGGDFTGTVTFAPLDTSADGIRLIDLYSIKFLVPMNTPTLKGVLQSPELYWDTGNKSLSDYGITDAYTKTDVDGMVNPISNRVDYIDGYIAGQRVRVSVTNYYGNTSGELPRMRIEEFVTETNIVDGVSTETNHWRIVWDEQNKYDRFLQEAKSAIAAMTNDLYQTYYQLLQTRLATKAPRAWGTLTSAGEAAPAGSVWHTEPNTVFAGGTEYAHAMVGAGVIGVLTAKGAAVYTDGETGRFHFTTDDRRYHFGMNISSRYEIGCATDGITVTSVGGNNMVELTYNITMTGKPILYYKRELSGTNTWEQITDSSGGAIPGATVYASWEQSPPAGSEICTINGGASLSGFFKASIEYAGETKFETNMMADFQGGVLATNQVNNQMQPIEPYITTNGVMWRLKR